MLKQIKITLMLSLCLILQACLGSVVGTVADVAIEVVKVPFKVGGAVVDVVTGEDLSETAKSASNEDVGEQAAATAMEAEGIQ